MKDDERACKFNMDTGCVELTLQDGRKISIGCTGVEDALNVTMAQQTELDYLIYNDPLSYADLILNGDPEEYLKNAAAQGRGQGRAGKVDLGLIGVAFQRDHSVRHGSFLHDLIQCVHEYLHLFRRANGDAQPVLDAGRVEMAHQNAVFL